MSGPQILIVEDDPSMLRFLRTSLTAQSFRVLEATTAREALVAVTTHSPELVLLDLGLPDGDGLDVTAQIRGWSRVPIIVLSARGREQDKVAVLDAGADDYLTKPFGVGELLARIRVALRHAQARGEVPSTPIIQVGALRIDRARREVTMAGAPVHLTPLEYGLLLLLAENAGKVLTHTQILRHVWGPAYASQTHYLRVYMAQLRRKLEPSPGRQTLLQTESGVGYRMRDEPPST